VNLLNSKYIIEEEPKVVEAVYSEVRALLHSRLDISIFLARTFDVIQVLNMKYPSPMFLEIQSSLLSIIEQLVDLESIGRLNIPGLVNGPECIEIQIEKIQQEFDLTLAIKNKVTLLRQYFKLQEVISGLSNELSSEVHHFELKVEDMLKHIEVGADLREIQENGSLRIALFKLVLYLLHQVQRVMVESDWKLQAKLVP
jgi:hypothetical protein